MENLKKVLALMFEMANVICLMIADAKAGAGVAKVLSHLMNVMDEVMAVLSVEWSLLDDEWKASRAEGHATMKAAMKAKFDLADDALEEVVEGGFELFGAVDVLVTKCLALAKHRKAA